MVAALDWFFEQVDAGIVLEDDCVPHEDFFLLADMFLQEYRQDSAVWGFSGDNSLGLKTYNSDLISFIRYPLIWGWATWADRWKRYDRELSTLDNPLVSEQTWSSHEERLVLEPILRGLKDLGTPDTWDYQWAWTVMVHRGLWAFPAKNLISNQGFDHLATHTRKQNYRAGAATFPVSPTKIKWPRALVDERASKSFLRRALRSHRRLLADYLAFFKRSLKPKFVARREEDSGS